MGGTFLGFSTHNMLNQVVQEGLPEDWIQRRLVLIHKTDSKIEVTNYRTIMIASIFAKVLGGLLATRLSSWLENTHEMSTITSWF